MSNGLRARAYLDKCDVEALMQVWMDLLIEEASGKRGKPVYHMDVRPIIKKLAKLVEIWEALEREERRAIYGDTEDFWKLFGEVF